jgi:hypothetical protein
MKVNGGCEPGGSELIDHGVGTLHIIKFDGTLLYAGTPNSAVEIFDKYVSFDENKIDPEPTPQDVPLDGEYT